MLATTKTVEQIKAMVIEGSTKDGDIMPRAIRHERRGVTRLLRQNSGYQKSFFQNKIAN